VLLLLLLSVKVYGRIAVCTVIRNCSYFVIEHISRVVAVCASSNWILNSCVAQRTATGNQKCVTCHLQCFEHYYMHTNSMNETVLIVLLPVHVASVQQQ
jgi:hypothetical protein